MTGVRTGEGAMVLCAGHTTREQGSYSESVQCHTEADARGMGSGAGVPHLFLPETPSGKCHYSEFLENGNPHLSNLSWGSSKEMVRLEVEGDDPRMSPNANSSHHRKRDLEERQVHVGGFQRGWDGCQQFCDSLTGSFRRCQLTNSSLYSFTISTHRGD